MGAKKYRLVIFWSGIFFILLDRFLKQIAISDLPLNAVSVPLIGWYPFLNYGVAFGIPFPLWLTIAITLPLVLACTVFIVRKYSGASSFVFVALGAASNLHDRIVYGATIDYFAFFYAVINLSDVMIVAGVGWYLWANSQKNPAPYVH